MHAGTANATARLDRTDTTFSSHARNDNVYNAAAILTHDDKRQMKI